MKEHPLVQHPSEYLVTAETKIQKFNDWAASHLAILFGTVWTVWCFLICPLVLLLLPSSIRNGGFFLSSGWIQLWALPLFVYVGNKLQRSQDAQSDAQHVALTHIANEVEGISHHIHMHLDGKEIARAVAEEMRKRK